MSLLRRQPMQNPNMIRTPQLTELSFQQPPSLTLPHVNPWKLENEAKLMRRTSDQVKTSMKNELKMSELIENHRRSLPHMYPELEHEANVLTKTSMRKTNLRTSPKSENHGLSLPPIYPLQTSQLTEKPRLILPSIFPAPVEMEPEVPKKRKKKSSRRGKTEIRETGGEPTHSDILKDNTNELDLEAEIRVNELIVEDPCEVFMEEKASAVCPPSPAPQSPMSPGEVEEDRKDSLAYEEELALNNQENKMSSKQNSSRGTKMSICATNNPVPDSASTQNHSEAHLICVMPRVAHATTPTKAPVTHTEEVGHDLVNTVSICVSQCISEMTADSSVRMNEVPTTKAKVEPNVCVYSKVVRRAQEQVAPTVSLTDLSIQREEELKEICGTEELALVPSGWDSDSESEDCNGICGTKEVVLTPSGWDSDSDSDFDSDGEKLHATLFPEKDCNEISGTEEASGWDSDSGVVEFFGPNEEMEPETEKVPATLSLNVSSQQPEEDCKTPFEAVTEQIKIRVNSPDDLEDYLESSIDQMETENENLDVISESSEDEGETSHVNIGAHQNLDDISLDDEPETSEVQMETDQDQADSAMGAGLATLTQDVEGIWDSISPNQRSHVALSNTNEDINATASPVSSPLESEDGVLLPEEDLSLTARLSPSPPDQHREAMGETEEKNSDFDIVFDQKTKKWKVVKEGEESPLKWWRRYLRSKFSRKQQMREELGVSSGLQHTAIRPEELSLLWSEEIKMAASMTEEKEMKAEKKRKGIFKIFSKKKKDDMTKSPDKDEVVKNKTKSPSLIKRVFGRKN